MRTVKTSAGKVKVENLEARTLMSAWGTVDTYQLSAGENATSHAMATDSAGNAYAAGQSMDTAGHFHGIIREQAAGSSTWTTVEDYTVPTTISFGGVAFRAIAIDGAGDIYVAGTNNASGSTNVWTVLEKPAGSTGFSVVDAVNNGAGFSLAVDQSGNVFAGGRTWTTVASKGKNTTTTYYWTVRKQTGGQGAFGTVDNAISGTVFAGGSIVPGAIGATSIPSGPSAGLYFVGLGSSGNWLVRKSTNAGVTWTTVDSFVYAPNHTTSAESITSDAAGNLYVVGWGNSTTEHWLVRKSTNGGSSWSTDDDFAGISYPNAEAFAVGTDLAGNVYVVGDDHNSSISNADGIVRTNAGGTWTTVNTMSNALFSAFTRDPGGNLYAAGNSIDSGSGSHWVVQSAGTTSSPAASAAAAVFSSTPISGDTSVDDLLQLHRRRHR